MPLLRVTRGQQRSLTSPVAGYPQVNIGTNPSHQRQEHHTVMSGRFSRGMVFEIPPTLCGAASQAGGATTVVPMIGAPARLTRADHLP